MWVLQINFFKRGVYGSKLETYYTRNSVLERIEELVSKEAVYTFRVQWDEKAMKGAYCTHEGRK